jgi:hypothetical protein
MTIRRRRSVARSVMPRMAAAIDSDPPLVNTTSRPGTPASAATASARLLEQSTRGPAFLMKG